MGRRTDHNHAAGPATPVTTVRCSGRVGLASELNEPARESGGRALEKASSRFGNRCCRNPGVEPAARS